MKIRFSFLTDKTIRLLPVSPGFPRSCKYCLYWETPDRLGHDRTGNYKELIKRKIAWLRDVRNGFGNCGFILYINEKMVGYAQYSPVRYLPQSMHYPVFPSPDAIVISCLYIMNKKYRRQGFGTVLLNAVIEDLEKRSVKVIETIARKGSDSNPSGPAEFYLKNEFTIYRDDSKFPVMRFNFQSSSFTERI